MRKFFKSCLMLVLGSVVLAIVVSIILTRDISSPTVQKIDLTTPEGIAELAEMEARAKAIPASELKANLRAYQELVVQAPDNQMYNEKVEIYRTKIEDAEAAVQRARARRQKLKSVVDAAREMKVNAWIMAKQFVTDQLKAPSTAEWGSVFKGTYQDPQNCVTALSDNHFRCKGWVDSQNGFGAMIRTRFVCTVKYVGDSKWSLVSLTSD